jgi:hypothetical protein
VTEPPDTARKVRQLDHDVHEIYQILAAISETQRQHGTRLERLEKRLDRQGSVLDQHSAMLQELLDLLRTDPPSSN